MSVQYISTRKALPAFIACVLSSAVFGEAHTNTVDRAVFGEAGPDEEHSVESLARTAISRVGPDGIPRIIQMVGEDDPFCPHVKRLAEALDVSIAWLMGYDVPIGHYDAPPILARTQAERVKSKIDQLTKNQLDLIESLVNQFLS